jgi:hypothetical protein
MNMAEGMTRERVVEQAFLTGYKEGFCIKRWTLISFAALGFVVGAVVTALATALIWR